VREIPCELIGGPWDGRVGVLEIGDTPPPVLTYSLADAEVGPALVIPGHVGTDSKLIARYNLVDERPRKIVTMEEVNGHPRAVSALGVRYRYDKTSPCEELFREAERDVLLTAAAHDQVMETRRLLLAEAKHGREDHS
jgi:hypothetical protein